MAEKGYRPLCDHSTLLFRRARGTKLRPRTAESERFRRPGPGSAELGLEGGVVPVVALRDNAVAEEVVGRDDVKADGFPCVVTGHAPFHDRPVGGVAVGMPDRVVETGERVDLAAQVAEHRRTAVQPGVGVAVLDVVGVEPFQGGPVSGERGPDLLAREVLGGGFLGHDVLRWSWTWTTTIAPAANNNIGQMAEKVSA